jgi:hypothetical protein
MEESFTSQMRGLSDALKEVSNTCPHWIFTAVSATTRAQAATAKGTMYLFTCLLTLHLLGCYNSQ